MELERIQAEIAAAIATVEQAIGRLGAVRGAVDESVAQLDRVTTGTSNPLPGEALARWRDAAAEGGDAASKLAEGRANATAYLRVLSA